MIYGSNDFSLDDHEKYKENILSLLGKQVSRKQGVKLYSDGSTTESGDNEEFDAVALGIINSFKWK